VRVTPGLQGLVAGQLQGSAYAEDVVGGDRAVEMAMSRPGGADASDPAGTVRSEVGRGRVAYIPSMEFDGTMPPAEAYFTIGFSLWKRPKNWQQLMDAIVWASNGEIPLAVDGPGYVIANLVEQRDRHRRMVHLVNCDAEHVSAVTNVRVRCALGAGESAATVLFRSLDSPDGEKLRFETKDGMVSFTVPSFRVYGVVEVSA
jgi:hypothetical protein